MQQVYPDVQDWFEFVLCQGRRRARGLLARRGVLPRADARSHAWASDGHGRVADDTYTTIPTNAEACAQLLGLDLAPVYECVDRQGVDLHTASIALTKARSITYTPQRHARGGRRRSPLTACLSPGPGARCGTVRAP